MSLKDVQLFNYFDVSLHITNRIVGGIPNNPKLIEGWLSASMPDVAAEERAKLAETTIAELPKAADEKAQSMWTTFKRDEKGLYIEGRQVKAMFKEASNVLRDLLLKKEGTKKGERSRFTNLKSRVAERVFVMEDKIYLHAPDDKVLAQPSGQEERAIHVVTAQGPRSALKRCDYAEDVTLHFTCRVLADNVVDEELLRLLLEYAGVNGLGADRSQGNGLFEVTRLEERKKAA